MPTRGWAFPYLKQKSGLGIAPIHRCVWESDFFFLDLLDRAFFSGSTPAPKKTYLFSVCGYDDVVSREHVIQRSKPYHPVWAAVVGEGVLKTGEGLIDQKELVWGIHHGC